MKTIDFSKLGGLPLTQDLLDFILKASSDPLIAFAELGGTTPHIITGMVNSGTTISSGFLYYQGDVVPFTGGVIPVVGGVPNTSIVINTYKNTLEYGNGNSYQSQAETKATFGTGAVTFNYTDLKTFQEGFGARSLSGWKNIFNVGSGSVAGSVDYHYNAMTKSVFIRGFVKVPQNYTQLGYGIMNAVVDLPALIRPSDEIYFRTNIEPHGQAYIFSADGSLFLGDVGRIDPINGTLGIAGRPLQGSPLSPYQNFNFSYQL